MRILIIGGTGTISSAITRQLAQTDHNCGCSIAVTAATRFREA